jgi:hypothetical protein
MGAFSGDVACCPSLEDFKCVSSLLIAVAALWLSDMARGGQFDHWPCRSVMSAGEGILRGLRSHDHRDGGRDGEAAVAAPRHVVTGAPGKWMG